MHPSFKFEFKKVIKQKNDNSSSANNKNNEIKELKEKLNLLQQDKKKKLSKLENLRKNTVKQNNIKDLMNLLQQKKDNDFSDDKENKKEKPALGIPKLNIRSKYASPRWVVEDININALVDQQSAVVIQMTSALSNLMLAQLGNS